MKYSYFSFLFNNEINNLSIRNKYNYSKEKNILIKEKQAINSINQLILNQMGLKYFFDLIFKKCNELFQFINEFNSRSISIFKKLNFQLLLIFFFLMILELILCVHAKGEIINASHQTETYFTINNYINKNNEINSFANQQIHKFDKETIDLRNHDLYQASNFTNKVLFYTHGDYNAVRAMKLDFNVRPNKKGKYLSEGLINYDLNNYTHICSTSTYTLAVINFNKDSIQNVVIFGKIGWNNRDVIYESGPRILWSLDTTEIGIIILLECGSDHSFILTSNNQLFVFGSNNFGQLGMDSNMNQFSSFMKFYSLNQVKKVSTSRSHSLFLDSDNSPWVSGLFETKNDDSIFISTLTKLTFNTTLLESNNFNLKENNVNIVHISASKSGGILVSDNNCLYAYGYLFGKTIQGSFNLTQVHKLDTICDHKKVFITEDGQRIFSQKFNNSLFEINEEMKSSWIINLNVDIEKIISHGSLVGFILSNQSILASSDKKIWDIQISKDFNFIRMPTTNNLIKQISCSDFHCALIGDNDKLYTVGINSSKTCNTFNNPNVTQCRGYDTYNCQESNCNIHSVVHYIGREIGLAIFGSSFGKSSNLGPSFINIINESVLEYKQREIYSQGSIFFHKNWIIDTIFPININLQVYINNYSMPLSKDLFFRFEDFYHATTINLYDSSEGDFAIYHLAGGELDKSLTILNTLNNLIALIERVEYYWISNSISSQTLNITGIKDECNIFIFKLPESIVNYYSPEDGKCLRFIKIASNYQSILLKYPSVILLSEDGQVYNATLKLFSHKNNTYELKKIEIPITLTNNDINPFIISIAITQDNSLYLLSQTGSVYYLSNNHSEIIPISNVTNIQSFEIFDSTGVQIYQNNKCNQFAADDHRVCNGHGICIESKCICLDPYEGINCDNKKKDLLFTCNGKLPNDTQACSLYEICVGQNQCKCKNHFFWTCINPDYPPFEHLVISSIIPISLGIFVYITISFIIFSTTLSIIIYIITRILIKKYKNKDFLVKRQEEIIQELIRDQEIDGLEEEKKVWELYKKHFQVNGSEISVISKIGSGGEGSVYLANWRNLKVAVKYYNCKLFSEDDIANHFIQETGLMSSLRHPNIVSFYGATLSYPRVGFIMEYCSQSVDKFIENGEVKNVPSTSLINILEDVCRAMSYLHSNNIIHRDLKWQNVLLDDKNQCKITDFGMSRIKDSFSISMTQNIGTGIYIAPENYCGLNYDTKVDVYAFGIMIFELLCGKLNPWSLDEKTKSLSNQRIASLASHNHEFRPNVEFLRENGYEFFISICKSCWSHNPEERPTFDEILEKIHTYYND